MPAGAEDVFDVAYTFPDGHTEHATKATDAQGRTWWRMIYAYDDGSGNEMEKPEIEVTMSLSGVQRHYTLAWGEDTCAQVFYAIKRHYLALGRSSRSRTSARPRASTATG